MGAVCAISLGGATLLALAARRVCISGMSMAPTLMDGDRVLVSRLTYRLRPPRRGEVVLAAVRSVPGELTVKRVAAAPGSEVPVELFGARTNPAPATPDDGRVAVRLAADEYLLLGDNAEHSTDGRHFGVVARRHIIGRVWYRYWPWERRGQVR